MTKEDIEVCPDRNLKTTNNFTISNHDNTIFRAENPPRTYNGHHCRCGLRGDMRFYNMEIFGNGKLRA